MGVIEQTMSGHIAADLPPGATIVSVDVIKHLLQRAAIEEILELSGAPLSVCGTVRRLPIFAVVISPLALEPFLVAVLHPKFRFLEMNRFDAGIERALHAQT